MDIDEDGPLAEAPLDALEKEDLSPLSQDDLEARIARLKAEQARTQDVLESKSAQASQAEQLFKL